MSLDNPVETLRQLMRAGQIISNWSKEFRARYGGSLLPESYFTFDLESSGFSRDKDFILEWGHCVVRDRKVEDRASFLVNWYDAPDSVPAAYLDRQLERIAQDMRVDGRTWRITPELLKTKGVAPSKFVPWLFDYLTEVKEQGLLFVSHNGINFDIPMILSHFKNDLGENFDFGQDQVFDTGAVEKASQMSDEIKAMPQRGESMHAYFRRIAYCKAAGVQWNLDQHCMEKYRLVEKYNVDPSKSHTAGEDSYALYGLMEEFRALAEAAEKSKMARGIDQAAFRVEYLNQPIAKQHSLDHPKKPMPWEPAVAAPLHRPVQPQQHFRRQRSR